MFSGYEHPQALGTFLSFAESLEVCSGFAKKMGWPQDLIDRVQSLFAEAFSSGRLETDQDEEL